MLNKIILASKSKVRKKILDKHKILCEVKPSNVDEDIVKETLIKESASPEIISKNFDTIDYHSMFNNLHSELDHQEFFMKLKSKYYDNT